MIPYKTTLFDLEIVYYLKLLNFKKNKQLNVFLKNWTNTYITFVIIILTFIFLIKIIIICI